MPRTTIDIDAPILEALKRIQRSEGTSLGAVASSLLADALATRKDPVAHRKLRWNVRSMKPRVPLEDKEAIAAVLEEGTDASSG
jgi:hypothetical protein